ncbi:MAG: hypothetical protein Q4P17_06685 [Methanobacterium sp.]|nr:hypothetical protein [Methanobacterium sp.]
MELQPQDVPVVPEARVETLVTVVTVEPYYMLVEVPQSRVTTS